MLSDAPTTGTETPVVLFVYRRHEQLARTLACLRDDGIELLYVFSDGAAAGRGHGPTSSASASCCARSDWARSSSFEPIENIGLSASIRAGLDLVFERSRDGDCDRGRRPRLLPSSAAYAEPGARALPRAIRASRAVTGLRLPVRPDVSCAITRSTSSSPRASPRGRGRRGASVGRSFVFDPARCVQRIAASRDFRPWRAGADLAAMIHDAIVTETLRRLVGRRLRDEHAARRERLRHAHLEHGRERRTRGGHPRSGTLDLEAVVGDRAMRPRSSRCGSRSAAG